MKAFFLLMCITYANSFYIEKSNVTSKKEKIVGGVYSSITEANYQASLIFHNKINFCGAVIIDKSWLLTAAHCLTNQTLVEGTKVSTGNTKRLHDGTSHAIKNVILHPGFDDVSFNNDIAIIELQDAIKINETQKPIPITKMKGHKMSQMMKVSGYGKEGEDFGPSQTLKIVNVKIIAQKRCQKRYPTITENMFCAGNKRGDSCNGDSGGPGVVDGKLYGIISSGERCASDIYPGVYIAVHNYYDWIVKHTGLKL